MYTMLPLSLYIYSVSSVHHLSSVLDTRADVIIIIKNQLILAASVHVE